MWKIQRKLESEKKEGTKSSKIQILENELKISQKNTNDLIRQNQSLRDENTELKEKIKRMEMLYEKRKIEIDVTLDQGWDTPFHLPPPPHSTFPPFPPPPLDFEGGNPYFGSKITYFRHFSLIFSENIL